MLRDWTSVLGRVQKRERERCSRNRSHSQKPKPKTKTETKTKLNGTEQYRIENTLSLANTSLSGCQRGRGQAGGGGGRGSKWVAGCNGSKCRPQAHKSACMKWCSCVSFFSCFQAKCRHSLGRKLWGIL